MAEERERAPAGGGGQAAEGGGPPLHLRYTMKAWLRLQEAVNCFIDTSSAENPPKASQVTHPVRRRSQSVLLHDRA